MRKEIVYAILSGIFFGLVVAFGVWRANLNLVAKEKTNIFSDTIQKNDKPNTPSDFTITIAKPEDSKVETTDKVDVTGITLPEKWVLVSTEEEDLITMSDTAGAFTSGISLIPGVNQIKVSAFSLDGKVASDEIAVVYSKDFDIKLDEKKEDESDEESASDSVRKRVQEKVKETLLSPKAYIGVITDISSNTIQLSKFSLESERTKAQEINQVSIDATTNFVKYVSNESKSIKKEDLAIGDFIIAMGYINQNQVLTAQRIMVTTTIKPTERVAYFGQIEKTGKTLLLSTQAKDDKFSLDLLDSAILTGTKATQTVKIKEVNIDSGVNVIVSGSFKKDELITRRLHVLDEIITASPAASTKSN